MALLIQVGAGDAGDPQGTNAAATLGLVVAGHAGEALQEFATPLDADVRPVV